jgi:predicted nucleotidyltransferase component of viral defense system
LPLPRPSRHNILTSLQEQVLAAVFDSEAARENFALVGGTALAEFYFGHRLSRDLDVFSETTEDIGFLADDLPEIIETRVDDVTVEVQRRSPAFRRFLVRDPAGDSVRVDLAPIDPPLFDPIARIGGLNVLGLTDLAVGKLMAAHDRVEIRDAIDLWALERAGVDLVATRELALLKDPGLAQAPLLLIDSLERISRLSRKAPWPRMLVALNPDELEEFLNGLSERYLTEIWKTM